MAARSAGLLLYRRTGGRLEVLLGHMGGPFWARRDDGAWSVLKGEYDEGEQPLAVARREFEEETGFPAPAGEPVDLGEVTQRNGKVVRAWAVEGDLDAAATVSNTFTLEWPRGSGRLQEFPEIDRTAWLDLPAAATRLVAAQRPFLDRLADALGSAAR